MTESNTSYGNEPLEPAVKNGEVIPSEALFEYDNQDSHFANVDKLVDAGVANYHDAKRRLDYDPLQYDAVNYDSHPGASVELGERALAVAQLMDGISAQNKLSGALQSNAIDKYSNPKKVLTGMERRAATYRANEDEAVEHLAKTAALRAQGFNEAEIAASQAEILRNVSRLRGVGKEAVRLRNKQKTITARTARIVAGSR